MHGAKYWFLEQNLPEVLLKSVSELPLLVYGRLGLLQDNPQNPIKEGELWEKHAAPIFFEFDGTATNPKERREIF